jgi:hypothetical protein
MYALQLEKGKENKEKIIIIIIIIPNISRES